MMEDQSKPRQLYNVGNPEEFTVKDLAKKVIKLTNSKSEIINLELPADDPVKRKPDITEIRSDLGWEPKITLEEMVHEMMENDINIAKRDSLVKQHGFDAPDFNEFTAISILAWPDIIITGKSGFFFLM